ncbi:DUF1552 domain-containing protein [Agarilytica rhodophyticola]|uniref:DUF1552 domain-containing protein n=1 Tax=Agarilytica rhodophyticola TaxID=1737490 RepID=UPI000B34133D|nr:DUF1552 domain-containing protein [Agarilytica rhodophyticola]
MNILKNKIQRRDFLRNLARAGMTVAFTSQWVAPKAFAQSNQAKRFVMVYYPNGVARGDDKWHQFNIGALGSNSFANSPLSQLSDHADKIVAFKNLTFAGVGGSSGHPEACRALFAGGNTGTTFDVALGESIGGRLRNNIHLGVWSSRAASTEHMPFSDKNGRKILVPDDPQTFFNVNLSSFQSSGSVDPEDEMRQRILASLHENLDILQEQQLNITQSGKLLSHEEALNFYQTILNSSGAIDGIVSPGIGMTGINEEAHALAEAQMRNIAMCFQADITNVASLQFMGAQDDSLKINFPSIRPYMGDFGSGPKLEYNETKSHVASHDEKPTFTAQAHWYCQQVNYLVEQLSARADNTYGGTLMDNTAILVMSEMGGGNHQQENPGVFVVAGTNTGINIGQGIDAGNKTVASLFWDISNAFGRGWPNYGKSNGGIPGFLV